MLGLSGRAGRERALLGVVEKGRPALRGAGRHGKVQLLAEPSVQLDDAGLGQVGLHGDHVCNGKFVLS